MKLSFLAIIALLVTSCGPFGFNPMGYDYLHEDLDTAWKKTASFRYIPESGNYMKSPKEFEHDGGGDCEDFAAYLMYRLGDESKLAIIHYLTGGDHAIVYYNGRFIEPQIYERYYPDDISIYYWRSWADTMALATYRGKKSLH